MKRLPDPHGRCARHRGSKWLPRMKWAEIRRHLDLSIPPCGIIIGKVRTCWPPCPEADGPSRKGFPSWHLRGADSIAAALPPLVTGWIATCRRPYLLEDGDRVAASVFTPATKATGRSCTLHLPLSRAEKGKIVPWCSMSIPLV